MRGERGERGERGDRERQQTFFRDRRDRSFYRSPTTRDYRDVSFSSLHSVRGRGPRAPLAQFPRSHRDSSRLASDHSDWKGVYDASKLKPDLKRYDDEGVRDRQRDGSRERPIKKTFRELFTERDIEEGGDWVRVKRKADRPRLRHRSPIIKRPCFRCGLEGHIRRNCPRRSNMRCFGCSSTTHLVKDCTMIHRPDETKVELTELVYEITDKVQALSNFAIFRARGEVNQKSLRAALIKGVWEANWEGKIIPIDSKSFLVGFGSECHRDMAVLAGKIMFDGFSGTFYDWNEDRGAELVYRPVIVWLTMESLPLHLWGKEEITKIVSSFGKVHKFEENLFKKKRADVVKVMVEVEDVSVIPKVVQCSYKSITDNRYRFYNVKLIPSATCLPVSQWTQDTYKLYEEAGGSRGEGKEEGWVHDGGQARGEEDAGRQARNTGGAHVQVPEGSVNTPLNVARDPAREEEALQREDVTVHVGHIQRDPVEQAVAAGAAETAEEAERRRKGKGVISVWAHEVHMEGSPEPNPIISGSGSCEPMNEDGLEEQAHRSASSDSKANPTEALGKSKDKPILISAGNSQDEDMGGTEGGFVRMETTREEEEDKKPVLDHARLSQEDARKAAMEVRGSNGKGDKANSQEGSKGTSGSVPPGYTRKPKSQIGGSSPFVKLQRGGFKFLKRPASSATSGQKQAKAVGAKRSKPITMMADKDIADVARNVGVEKELTEEQIGRIKAQERDRASS